MTDKLFFGLWADALTSIDRDAYISDWALSTIWQDSEDTLIPDHRIEHLGSIWDAAHMSIRDILSSAGLKQSEFATKFCIPYRTVQNWCGDVNKCPDYVRLMLMRLLNHVNI